MADSAVAAVVESLSRLKLFLGLFWRLARRLLGDLLLLFLLDFLLVLPLLLGLLDFGSGYRILIDFPLLFESFRPLPEYLFD